MTREKDGFSCRNSCSSAQQCAGQGEQNELVACSDGYGMGLTLNPNPTGQGKVCSFGGRVWPG